MIKLNQPNYFVYVILIVYFTAMVMLIVYLIYAKFSPIHQFIYAPTTIENQTIAPDHPNYCKTSKDCVVDTCNNCQVVNRNNLSGRSNICLVACPIEAICLNHQCLGVPIQQ